MLTREMTYGEDLRYEVHRSPYNFIDIATVCRHYEDAAPSTYQRLLELDDVSGPGAPKRKLRRRLRLVCLALDIPPTRYGLTDEDRGAQWPGDQLLTRRLKSALRALIPRCSQVARDLLRRVA